MVLASRSETARGEWEAYKDKIVAKPIGSVAYKLALVAAGQADATFTATPKSEWDIASGAALMAEAGGVMTDIHGRSDPLQSQARQARRLRCRGPGVACGAEQAANQEIVASTVASAKRGSAPPLDLALTAAPDVVCDEPHQVDGGGKVEHARV